jgi:hypothetical protein
MLLRGSGDHFFFFTVSFPGVEMEESGMERGEWGKHKGGLY